MERNSSAGYLSRVALRLTSALGCCNNLAALLRRVSVRIRTAWVSKHVAMPPNAFVPKKGVLLFINCPWMLKPMAQLPTCPWHSSHLVKRRVEVPSVQRSALTAGVGVHAIRAGGPYGHVHFTVWHAVANGRLLARFEANNTLWSTSRRRCGVCCTYTPPHHSEHTTTAGVIH